MRPSSRIRSWILHYLYHWELHQPLSYLEGLGDVGKVMEALIAGSCISDLIGLVSIFELQTSRTFDGASVKLETKFRAARLFHSAVKAFSRVE